MMLTLRPSVSNSVLSRTRQLQHPKKQTALLRCFRSRLAALEDRTLPSTFVVTNLDDSGFGSLRAAVTAANANPGSTIDFAHGLHGTITLTSGELDISSRTTSINDLFG